MIGWLDGFELFTELLKLFWINCDCNVPMYFYVGEIILCEPGLLLLLLSMLPSGLPLFSESLAITLFAFVFGFKIVLAGWFSGEEIVDFLVPTPFPLPLIPLFEFL